MPDAERASRKPDATADIVSSGSFEEQGFVIQKITLKLYVEKRDEKLGDYSLITSEVQTDRGSVEMIYDEGYRGADALDRAAKFLTDSLGISGLVTRSVIALRGRIDG